MCEGLGPLNLCALGPRAWQTPTPMAAGGVGRVFTRVCHHRRAGRGGGGEPGLGARAGAAFLRLRHRLPGDRAP